jgi:hypothetical protein
MYPCIGLDPTADLAVAPGPGKDHGDTPYRASTTNETT